MNNTIDNPEGRHMTIIKIVLTRPLEPFVPLLQEVLVRAELRVPGKENLFFVEPEAVEKHGEDFLSRAVQRRGDYAADCGGAVTRKRVDQLWRFLVRPRKRRKEGRRCAEL